MKSPKPYSAAALKQQILADAKSLHIPDKWAQTIASKAAAHVDTWIKGRGAVTQEDIIRVAHQKLVQLHPDLAYIYKNRGKIL